MNYSPPNYNEDFRDRIAIVTGAASGIGRSIAEGLSYHRAQICMLDTNETKGHDVLNNLRKNSPSSEFYETDVSDRENVKKTIEKIVSEQGAPWILVNNAGIEYNDDGNLITMPEEKADEILNTNLQGYLNMLRSVVPYMIKNGGGRIVNVSSVQGIQSFKPGTIYQIVKAGIPAIARNMALEYGRQNIKVNTISPGAIKTEGMGDARINRDGVNSLRSLIPIGRRGHSEEIADVTLFLLSEKSSYIYGQNIIVDGGLLTHRQLGGLGVPEKHVDNDPEPNLF